jgi:hypothetical protein
MVTLMLHDEDAKALLSTMQRDDCSPLALEQMARIGDQLKCALALCDCGRGTEPEATQP